MTHREFSLGELAHIVGQQDTPGSPRGQVNLPQTERDKADNLMLLCAGDHNEIDRNGAVDVLTIEKLRKIKRDHEIWIRRAVGISRNRATVVLRMVGQLRGTAVELSRPTATDAVLKSDDHYPDFPLSYDRHGIEIDLRHVPGEATAVPQYWTSAAAIIDQVIDHQLKDGLVREQVRHLSVFAFARLPLLIYLGTKLDDTYPVAIYQRHRSTGTWDWPS
ncbi:MAG TPA: SAVED domain-containing protein, partial [Kribbella sp.]